VGLVAKQFDPTFYVTCATVIPVLFLAVAVSSSYKTVLSNASAAARAGRGEQRWARRIWPYLLSRILKFTGYGVWLSGALGELLALLVLYRGHEGTRDRPAVLALTLFLVFFAGSPALGAYIALRRELDELGFRPPPAPSGEAAQDQPGQAKPQADSSD
jgi:hypothetical protein